MIHSTIYRRNHKRLSRSIVNHKDTRPASLRILSQLPFFNIIVKPYRDISLSLTIPLQEQGERTRKNLMIGQTVLNPPFIPPQSVWIALGGITCFHQIVSTNKLRIPHPFQYTKLKQFSIKMSILKNSRCTAPMIAAITANCYFNLTRDMKYQ